MSSDEPQHGHEDSLIGHLTELRNRLLRAVAAVALASLAFVPFAQPLYARFARPLLERLPEGAQLVAIDVASPFFAPIKLALVLGLLAAMPVVLYQLWAFVAPGLYRHEQRLARPLLVSATLLFYIGCAFAWFAVLPLVFRFMAAITPEGVQMMTDISRYLDFVLVVLVAFGASFELPVAVVILVLIGVVELEQLRDARPYVIVGIFLVAAFVTPPDVISQVMLAVPMALLYELGLIAARLLKRRAEELPSA